MPLQSLGASGWLLIYLRLYSSERIFFFLICSFDLPWVQRLTIITDGNTLDCEGEMIWWELIMIAWLYVFSLKFPIYISKRVGGRAGEFYILFRKNTVSWSQVCIRWNIWPDMDMLQLQEAYTTYTAILFWNIMAIEQHVFYISDIILHICSKESKILPVSAIEVRSTLKLSSFMLV